MHKSIKKAGRLSLRMLGWMGSGFDRSFLKEGVPLSKGVSHDEWQRLIYEMGNKEGMRILEIGSREVTGD